MSDDGVVAEKRSRGRPSKQGSKSAEANDKEIKDTKKRGRPVKLDKAEKKIVKEGENGEPVAKKGRGRPKKRSSKGKVTIVPTGKGRGRPSAKKADKEESADDNDEEVEDED